MSDDAAPVTVVVANADETVCEVLARIVEAGGYEAVRITDPAQLTDAILRAPDGAVVVDLEAENVTQLRALRGGAHPRSISARVVVIVSGPANALLAWQADADAVLTRPLRSEELVAALGDVLDRESATRPAVRRAHIESLSV